MVDYDFILDEMEKSNSRCFSTKLGFCEGVVPYDVVQLPKIPGVNKYEDLKAVLPYFQTIIESGCSLRAREFICSLLEPECLPDSQRQAPPCKLNCKVVFDDCRDFIDQSSPLSKLFDCSRYPDWDESAENESECVNFSKGECYEEEHQCSDGTCIPLKWVCDGVHDCPGTRPSFDESDCKGCAENEFRCVLDGKCIPLHWKCDGQIDCTDHSDELSC
ncbi:hypothetical protein RUM44_002429 [Polyplax serrata]|uniref:FZ domain-containing protein n=1 Tax=Polyplax serrata TaxID=468196 RepID=A0ABR1AES0_POLSC